MRRSSVRLRRIAGLAVPAALAALTVPATLHLVQGPQPPAASSGPGSLFDFARRDTAWVDQFAALRREPAAQETTAPVGGIAAGEVADAGRPDTMVTADLAPDAADPAPADADPAAAPTPAVVPARLLLPPVPEPAVLPPAPRPPADAAAVPLDEAPSAEAGIAGGLAPAPWLHIRASAGAAEDHAELAPAAIRAAAPLPRRKPQDRSGIAQARAPAAEAAEPALGYAAASASADREAPFRAVLGTGTGTGAGAGAEAVRPGPALPPNLHAWAYADLPASVREPKEQKCLAEAVYFEARGESARGQAAVAQVVLNRVRNPAYPDRICAVVYQNSGRLGRCQFSFACDGLPEVVREPDAWERAVRVARDAVDGALYLDEVGDSTHYHASWVRPPWRRAMTRVARIGVHSFYRTVHGGWI